MTSVQTNSPSSSVGRRCRILLAEDDPELRALVALALQQDGFEVVEVEDGSALLDRLAEAALSENDADAFDLLVSDIRMPGYTALEVLIGMRQQLTRTPVMLVTAFGDAKLHDRALRLGAAVVLNKPFSLDALRENVARLLARKRGVDAPRSS
jgi:CheY-like chemotaxis protein